MGFVSPANDFAESTLTINRICNVGANTRVVETSAGYAVIDVSRRPQQGDTLLINYDGRTEFAKLMGRAFHHGRRRKRSKGKHLMMLK
ncbi:Uncharacterised protein [Raoultella ornithinolytica]|nr:Uncharacterised protein [Raoultella ornithinolytica]